MDKIPEYKFLELLCEENDTCPIQILSGQFKDIVYKYGKISLQELPNDELSVNMDITVITCPESFDQQNKEFTQTVGEIFVNIIENNLAETKTKEEPIDLEDDVHSD